MNQSNLEEDLKGFKCVEFFRKIRDKMSAELNAMTPEERHLYFERLHIKFSSKEKVVF